MGVKVWGLPQAKSSPTPSARKIAAPEWKGELLSLEEGAFYLASSLKDFPKSKQSKTLSGTIQILLVNDRSQQRVTVMHHHSDPTKPPTEIFKLPTGTYKFKAIAMIDNQGNIRKMTAGKNLPHLQIKPVTLTNYGLLQFHPQGRGLLQVEYFATKPLYRPNPLKYKSEFSAVIDGGSGRIQKVLAGKKVFAQARSSYSSQDEMRRSFGHTQKIAMAFKLNLYEHNRLAKGFMQALQMHDGDIRNCFVSQLNQGKVLRGQITFDFRIAAKSGTMDPLSYKGGSLRDPKVIKCLYYQLAQIQFPARHNIRGQLTYQFASSQ